MKGSPSIDARWEEMPRPQQIDVACEDPYPMGSGGDNSVTDYQPTDLLTYGEPRTSWHGPSNVASLHRPSAGRRDCLQNQSAGAARSHSPSPCEALSDALHIGPISGPSCLTNSLLRLPKEPRIQICSCDKIVGVSYVSFNQYWPSPVQKTPPLPQSEEAVA